MDGVQLPKGYKATKRRQFIFHQLPRNFWYSLDQPQKDERLSQPWSHSVVLKKEPLDWESRTITTRPLLQLLVSSRSKKKGDYFNFFCYRGVFQVNFVVNKILPLNKKITFFLHFFIIKQIHFSQHFPDLSHKIHCSYFSRKYSKFKIL